MAGKMICLLTAAVSLIVLLWLKAGRKEKNKQDAAKVLALTGILGCVICLTESADQRLTEDGRLLRNKTGARSDTQELQLDVDGILEEYNYTVEVEEQRMQGKELEQLFTAAAAEAEQAFLGENTSLDRIEKNVSL